MSRPSSSPGQNLDLALGALRRPLEFASRDGFANLDKVRDLGASLSGAARRLSTLVDKPAVRERLDAYARDVERWDRLPRTERERLAAAGLRLCATVGIGLPARALARADTSSPTSVDVAPPPVAPEGLATPLRGLPGVGPATAERLASRGLITVGDLLAFLPRRWDDLRAVVPIAALEPGRVQLTQGRVRSSRVKFAFRRRILEVVFEPPDAPIAALAPGPERCLVARWFHFRGQMAERFRPGALVLLSGMVRLYKDTLSVVHPETLLGDEVEAAARVRVRYPEVEGVPGKLVEKLARLVAERWGGLLEDGLPGDLRARLGYPSQAEAVGRLHGPPGDWSEEQVAALNAGTTPEQQRLVFDEFFFLQLGLGERRGAIRREEGPPLVAAARPGALDRFFAALPFSLTAAQSRVIAEVAADLAAPHPMNRLLQGDVGSGKTVVAWAACELAAASGMQAAVMAPTELLAEQHARTLGPWAKATGRRLALLSASTPRPARESTLALLAAGQLDVVVGTHALIADRVAFSSLGLCVIDEQHRFGVAQRAMLRDKAGQGASPHLLVMTATPIPRTLALTVYGDLDVSVLDELPPGRTPAETVVLRGRAPRQRALEELRAALREGRQAYWVCPLVEESDKIDLADVTEASTWLRRELDLEIGLVHGRLAARERDEVMARFRDGSLRVLVATTVIEVGVDVPSASLMVIEGAERFGLSQLHQLRGRIGRGAGRSRCVLIAGQTGQDARERLAIMAESSDGFEIAEADLRIRGPGEIFGTWQAGLPRLRYADLVRDIELLRQARAEALALLENDPGLLGHPVTRAVLDGRMARGELFGEEAG